MIQCRGKEECVLWYSVGEVQKSNAWNATAEGYRGLKCFYRVLFTFLKWLSCVSSDVWGGPILFFPGWGSCPPLSPLGCPPMCSKGICWFDRSLRQNLINIENWFSFQMTFHLCCHVWFWTIWSHLSHSSQRSLTLGVKGHETVTCRKRSSLWYDASHHPGKFDGGRHQ